MDLYYYETPGGNFGDDLNMWLWDALLPGYRDWTGARTLVGVGSVLRADALPDGRKLVLGSGHAYGAAPDTSDPAEWDIRAVRGPLTAERLGLAPEKAIADGAVMLPRLPEFQGIQRGEEVIFVPHHKSVGKFDWPAICARAGVGFQTPRADAHLVIRRLAGARAVIAESMHAAIIADAFGTPWRGASVTTIFNDFKWNDWAASLGMEPPAITPFFGPLRRIQGLLPRPEPREAAPAPSAAPVRQPGPGRPRKKPLAPLLARWAVSDLRNMAKGPFTLSDRARLAAVQDRFAAMLDGVRRDYD